MNNPELRAVLTEALAGHQPENYGFNCSGCNWEPANPGVTDAAEFAAHQLDVLDAVPGVAVIQLPEPDEPRSMSGTPEWYEDSWYVRPDAQGIRVVTGRDHLKDRSTQRLAAALVAAVVAKGEGSK